MENKKALVAHHSWGSVVEYTIGTFVRRTKTQFTLLVDGKEMRFKYDDPEIGKLSGNKIGSSRQYGNVTSAHQYDAKSHDHLLEKTRTEHLIENVKYAVNNSKGVITIEQWKAIHKILKGEQDA